MNDDLRSGFREYLHDNEPPFSMSPEPSIARARRRTARRRGAAAALGAALVVVAATAVTMQPDTDTPQALDPAGAAAPSATSTRSAVDLPLGVIIPVNQRPTLPALRGADLAGNPLTTDYAGRVTVINIWAYDCAPCRTEVAELAEARDGAAPDTRFIGLNHRDSPRLARAVQTRYQLSWPSLDDQDGSLLAQVQSVLDVRWLPTTLVVDEQGRVAAHITGGVESAELVPLLNALESLAAGDPRAADAAQGPGTCAPGTVPILTVGNLAVAQTRTAPTVEDALQQVFTDADLPEAVLEPMGPGPLAPVWARVGGDTFTVQADEPGQWYVVEATFDGCHTLNQAE